MNLQENTGNDKFHSRLTLKEKRENRHFPRYKIKRRLLIKDTQGHVLTGHAFDISRQGLQFRCAPHVAYRLISGKQSNPSDNLKAHEVKIALPYMNRLMECGIYCSVKDISKADEENMRIGLNFLYFEKNSQSRLNHFIDNLTL